MGQDIDLHRRIGSTTESLERRRAVGAQQADEAVVQAYIDANAYIQKRATAYPSIADQLDTIYHQGLDAWKATILAVKEEFPK